MWCVSVNHLKLLNIYFVNQILMADFLLLADIKALGLGEPVTLMKSSAIRSNSANKKMILNFKKSLKAQL